jgi:Tfp pilus assembly protein PilF
LEQGDVEGAIGYCQRAIEADPAYFGSHHLLAKAYQAKGDVGDAIKHYSKSIALQPDYINSYNELGKLLFSQHQLDRAEEIFSKALLFAPDDIALLHNLAVTCEAMGRKAEAARLLRRALEIDPGSEENRRLLHSLGEKE